FAFERRSACWLVGPSAVGIALAPRVAFRPPFLIALLLLIAELLPRILVLAAGPPVAAAHVAFCAGRRARIAPARRGALGVRRLPQLAACEPAQQHVLVRALQLRQRRQQFLVVTRAKCRRLAVDEDRPVREA